MSDFDFLSTFENAIKKNDSEQQIAILKKAIDEKGWKSTILSELALMVANSNLPFVNFMEAYCDNNLDTPHGAEIKLADIYAGQNRLDEATARARQFVSKLRGSEAEKDFTQHPILLTMVARCYLLMTAVYTHVGARSYSQRLLKRALSLKIPAPLSEKMKNEIHSLDREMADSNNKQINDKWEAFFNSGTNFHELQTHCLNKNAPHLARRIELIDGNFKFNSAYKVDDAEMLMDVFMYRESEDSTTPSFELK